MRRNILLLFVLSSICSAADRPRTDREIFFQLSDSLISLLSPDIREFPRFSLSVANDSSSLYFRPYLIRSLTERDYQIYLSADSTSTALELNVQESSVVYGELFTESLLSARKSERTATLTLVANLYSTVDGEVLRSRTLAMTQKDTVAYSMIDQLSSSSIPYSRYTKPELSFFDSVLEPAIVTISSGIVIYLFFTIRS